MTFVDAKTWNCRPSDLLAITDDYVAFCLDQAVGYFGRVVEADLEAVEGKTDAERNQKRDRVLQKYIGNEDEKPRRGQFADPAAMFS
jgi:hypothetical protein